MRSVFARIIAIAAFIPLISTLWHFIDLARQTYRWDGVAVPRETFGVLSDGIVTPILLFGVAAIVEMLFRIAEHPPAPAGEQRARAGELKPWRWRSSIAKLLVLAALLTGIAGVWSLVDAINATASLPDQPGDQRSMLVRGSIDAIIGALWVLGLAAVVEYLCRIAGTGMSKAEQAA